MKIIPLHRQSEESTHYRRNRRPSREEMVKGDRIMIVLLILAAVALAYFTYKDHKDTVTTTNITAQ